MEVGEHQPPSPHRALILHIWRRLCSVLSDDSDIRRHVRAGSHHRTHRLTDNATHDIDATHYTDSELRCCTKSRHALQSRTLGRSGRLLLQCALWRRPHARQRHVWHLSIITLSRGSLGGWHIGRLATARPNHARHSRVGLDSTRAVERRERGTSHKPPRPVRMVTSPPRIRTDAC